LRENLWEGAKKMREAVIIDAIRTPIGKKDGKLKDWHPVDLMAMVLKKIVEGKSFEDSLIDDVILGCVSQVGEQSSNVARSALLAAGFSETVPATTVTRQCGSSQQAIHFAAQGVMAGAYDVVIAGGIESMTRVPMHISGLGVADPKGSMYKKRFEGITGFDHQGISAEKIAKKWNISRRDMEELCCESHKRAHNSTKKGYFQKEILPIPYTDEEGNRQIMDRDEGIRPTTNMEILGTLKPAFFEGGRITAALASQISDAASAILIMEKSVAIKMGLKPRAKFVAFDVVGSDPDLMLTGPIDATKRILKKSGMVLEQIDLIEINEAFASVVLAWQKEMNADMSKVNINGGAMAIGHPLGATGTRMTTTLLHELERSNKRFGLQTLCEGGGLSNAMIIERI